MNDNVNSLDGLAADALDALFAPVVVATAPCPVCRADYSVPECSRCEDTGFVRAEVQP